MDRFVLTDAQWAKMVLAHKDDPDFVVYSGEWQIGRIYERRGCPDDVRWVWSLYGVVLTDRPDAY
jgi:hypothetical protein